MADIQNQDDTPSSSSDFGGQNGDSDNEERPPEVEEEEEEECRVCRGPSEEGRPLFTPCKCSGSIGRTHQDCLSSWLSMTRGNGRCELCSTKFRFAPKYAEGAPEQLAPYEVFLGLSRRALARWLPFALRFVIAMSMWLLVVPLVTSYLYHGWMHRPSSIATRWKWELVTGDIVSGVVISAVIIVSFLSLMSFGDFLRFHLHDRPGGQAAAARENDTEDGHVANEERVIVEIAAPKNNLPEGSTRNIFDNWRLGKEVARKPSDPADGVALQDRSDRDKLQGPFEGLDAILENLPDDPNEQQLELRRRVRAAAAAVAADTDDDTVKLFDNWRVGKNEIDVQPGDQNDRIAIQDPFEGLDAILKDLPDDPDEKQLELRRRIRAAAGDQNAILGLREREAELNERLENAESENENQILDQFMEQQENADEQEADRVAQIMQAHEANAGGGAGNVDGRDLQGDRLNDRRLPGRNDDLNEPPFMQRDPMMNMDDPGDVDINVALDELLGLGAPFSALIRNILWLLAFNTTYLGIFAFIPRTIGETVYARVFNSTAIVGAIHRIPYMKSEDEDGMSVLGMLTDLNAESERLNTALQLPDMSIIVLGYFCMAFLVLIWHWCMYLFWRKADDNAQEGEREGGERVAARRDARQPVPNFANVGAANDDQEFDRNFFDGMQHPDDEDVMGRVGEKFALAVECASAIVKVGVLLFFKMMLLPLLLGIWLDAATLDLFDVTGKDRVMFAGRDVFGVILLHWVVGITFMLLVTVSVLQLREVVHPDLLAPIIRPQEPQPDLLGNLLHEKGGVHAKRMVVSLGIYAALLMIHVWVPVRALALSGIGNRLPFFHPKFWHILTPQLQVPLELIIFHLCMLAFLEKYKNHIGQMQHRWLSFMCDKMGLTDFMMPKTVEKFVLVGSRPVFLLSSTDDNGVNLTKNAASPEKDTLLHGPEIRDETGTALSPLPEVVDPFWYDLATKAPTNVDEFILANLKKENEVTTPIYDDGRTKDNGARTLSFPETHIRLPKPSLSSAISTGEKQKTPVDKDKSAEKYLLSTTLGAYRLRKQGGFNSPVTIQFWREVRGETIPRPPEGWDDLGVGGAEVQGRWAWAKEKKSVIEESVAARTPVFGLGRSRLSSVYAAAKFILLLFLSWFASSVVVCCALSLPLIFGRFVLSLLRIPDCCIHDPVAFAIGGSIVFPTAIMSGDYVAKTSSRAWFHQLARWAISFRLPPLRKLFVFIQASVLWFIVAPLCLGILYDLLLVKSRSWFSLEDPITDFSSVALSWGLGTLLLNIWALLCYVGAFNGNFWVEIGVVLDVEEDELPANDRPEDVDRDPVVPAAGGEAQTDSSISGWQGKNGRIARFAGIFKAVLCRWEWDRVDPVQLLDETAFPVAANLAASCWIPVIAYAVWLFAVDSQNDGILLPVVGDVDKGLYRMVIFRSFALLALLVQLASSFQGPLQLWFRAAHNAARDDRYLVGEVLMNHVSSERNGGQTRQ